MRLAIATKIFLAFTAMLLTFGAVLTFTLYQMRSLYGEVELIHGGYLPLSLTLSDVKSDLRTYNVLLGEKEWSVLKRTLQATRQHYDFPAQVDIKLGRAQRHIQQLLVEAGPERAFLQSLQREVSQSRQLNEEFRALSDKFARAVLEERFEEAEAHQAELRRMARRLESRVRASQQLVREEVDTALLRGQRGERSALLSAVVLSAIALLLSAGIMLVTHWNIRPLRRVTEGAKRIAGGDYRPLAPVRGHDEIALLSREFNKMVARLADREEALRQQTARLVKSERLAAVGELATKVTHELRNPLSTIRLNAEILAEEMAEHGVATGSEPQDTLQSIAEEVERLTALTEDYLRFARLPEPQPVLGDLNELVEAVVDFQRDELELAGLEVNVALAEGLPPVKLDAAQLRRALLNLTRNAREAMVDQPGGRLEVRTLAQDGGVLLEVADNGCGMPPEQRERIFEPFFSTKHQGTGLGLPLTLQIVEEHNGSLTCQSAPGEGTRFCIWLPAG